MKKTLVKALIIPAIALGAVSCETPKVDKPYNQGINITPTPLELTQNEGEFLLTKGTTFVSPDESADKVVAFFAAKIKMSTGFDLKIQKEKPQTDYINFEIVSDITTNDEGYLLDVTAEGINIKAKTPQGLFYGMQSVMQLLPAEIESPTKIDYIVWKMPAVSIKDEPRFKYRGTMIDVCRHFVDKEFLKKQLDILAMFKINTFHWHLTEDQGWRIEIKKYPKLAEISSKRTEGEGHTYGPYIFSQEEVKEVVAYAKERFITVIPEIEFPGHAVAALTAYPELSCTGGTHEVRNIWGVSNDIFCAGNDDTFKFMEDVLDEVIPLFESEYIHIGGDEAPKGRWEKCPKCQARIKAEGLVKDKDHSAEEKLQSYFIRRVEAVLAKHGKKLIGWDEILEGGLAPSATVMSWRGEKGGIAAGNMGHDVIMTPSPWLYLDAFQGDQLLAPTGIGSYTPIEKTYGYDPLPAGLAPDKQHHILGVQANLWAEYMYEPKLVEYYAYPRVLALSEVAWSSLDRKDYNDFIRRLDNQRVRLDMHEVNYYIPTPQDAGVPACNFIAFTDKATLNLETLEPTKIVYTMDGSEPNENSTVFTQPVEITENTVVKTRSILVSGKMGNVRTITFEKQTPAPTVEKPQDAQPGLKAEYYKGKTFKVAELEGQTPFETGQVAEPKEAKYRIPNYREVYEDDYISTVLTGYINIPEDGVYFFNTLSAELWIDGKLFISNEGTVVKQSKADRSIALAKGTHSVKMIRLSGIIGGWPPTWDAMGLNIRKADEPIFTSMDATWFK